MPNFAVVEFLRNREIPGSSVGSKVSCFGGGIPAFSSTISRHFLGSYLKVCRLRPLPLASFRVNFPSHTSLMWLRPSIFCNICDIYRDKCMPVCSLYISTLLHLFRPDFIWWERTSLGSSETLEKMNDFVLRLSQNLCWQCFGDFVADLREGSDGLYQKNPLRSKPSLRCSVIFCEFATNQLESRQKTFRDIWYWGLLLKCVPQFQFWAWSDSSNAYYVRLCTPFCAYLEHDSQVCSCSVFWMEVVEENVSHFSHSPPFPQVSLFSR